MPVEQADSNRPEVDDAYADARAAMDELKNGPAEVAEPEVAAEVAEPVKETAAEIADRVRDEKGRLSLIHI